MWKENEETSVPRIRRNRLRSRTETLPDPEDRGIIDDYDFLTGTLNYNACLQTTHDLS